MQLPLFLQEKVKELHKEIQGSKITDLQQNLTFKYKNQSGESKSLIENKSESLFYAISRMPATYAVVYTVLSQLAEQNLISDIETVLDVGSGTGAGYFAVKELDDSVNVSLFERDENMIESFRKLTDGEVAVKRFDLISDKIEETFDLVMTSYVLSEMKEQDRLNSVFKMLDATNKYLLIIDTGTPRVYENMMTIKREVVKKGYYIAAPCMTDKCALKNDYCQFFARVERSSLMKQAKSGELSYEDEKYFYLLIVKDEVQKDGERVIRRPVIKPNNIELLLCSKDGVLKKNFTKSNKEMFKKAKKSKINDII